MNLKHLIVYILSLSRNPNHAFFSSSYFPSNFPFIRGHNGPLIFSNNFLSVVIFFIIYILISSNIEIMGFLLAATIFALNCLHMLFAITWLLLVMSKTA